ncbi:hypothetical protein BV20DRAFT_381918 [Pilatotrama ljubarskyi]|nr:hypothetical protein BV20DRAFT_381918 [Pilatotrama ljubarskyi]
MHCSPCDLAGRRASRFRLERRQSFCFVGLIPRATRKFPAVSLRCTCACQKPSDSPRSFVCGGHTRNSAVMSATYCTAVQRLAGSTPAIMLALETNHPINSSRPRKCFDSSASCVKAGAQ